MSLYRKLSAFSLAEVLIVLGIVGSISAFTIPSLTSSSNYKERVTQLKKAYTILNDAQGRSIASYGQLRTWFKQDSSAKAYTKRYYDRMADFIKIGKGGSSSSVTDCFGGTSGTGSNSSKYSVGTLSNSTMDLAATFGFTFANSYQFILADGTSMLIAITDKTCSTNKAIITTNCPGTYCNICGYAFVDLDGPRKGKNTLGKDIFGFYIEKNAITPMGGRASNMQGSLTASTVAAENTAITNTCFTTGNLCTSWVLENESLDYLNAIKGVCDGNGKNLSWSVITCK